MTHKSIERLLSPYLDGELPELRGRELSEHLRSCESCRLRLEEMRTIKFQIHSAADVSLPDNFAYSVLRAVWYEKENSLVWLGAEQFARNVVFGLTLVVIVLVGLGTFLQSEPALRVDRYLAGEPADSLTRRVMENQGEISKEDVVLAALTK